MFCYITHSVNVPNEGPSSSPASGKYALVENSREFTLVPWRPILERHVGKQVSGIMRDDGISWTIGRQRGGPNIT